MISKKPSFAKKITRNLKKYHLDELRCNKCRETISIYDYSFTYHCHHNYVCKCSKVEFVKIERNFVHIGIEFILNNEKYFIYISLYGDGKVKFYIINYNNKERNSLFVANYMPLSNISDQTTTAQELETILTFL